MAPDIQPDIRWDRSLLDEAAAIVEAEWIRLRQDEALWERELADLLAEGSAPRPRPLYLGTLSARFRRPRAPIPALRRWLRRRWLPAPVSATQRSPPHHLAMKHVVRKGRCPSFDKSTRPPTPASAHICQIVASPRPTPTPEVGPRTHRHHQWRTERGPYTRRHGPTSTTLAR